MGRSERPGIEEPTLPTALAQCLRESDLVGWHRAGGRAAALLTETAVDPNTARLVGTKVLQSLGASLPADLARRLRVRIYRSEEPGDRVGLHRLFAGAGRASGRNTPLARKTLAVAGKHPAGTSMAERPGQLRQAPGAASPLPRLGEPPLPRRTRI